MSVKITCPKCTHQFEPTEALSSALREQMKEEYNKKWKEEMLKRDKAMQDREQELVAQRAQMQQQTAQLQAQKANIEAELAQRLAEATKAKEQELLQKIKVQVAADYEHEKGLLQEANKNIEEKLQEARAKELASLNQIKALKDREHELNMEVQRTLIAEREKMTEQLRKEEDEKSKLKEAEFQMRLKEKDKQLEDQRKLVEEMKRKAEQGSMQLQGEVQELALEQLLKENFPFDLITEVGKGVRGADCIQTVRNHYGQPCGKIIFESKRTKDFSEDWIEKLKADMRGQGADLAVLVTQAMPKDMNSFGERNGIWVCTFDEVKALVYVLRAWIIKVYNTHQSHENKGDKMTLLYNYLVSGEFAEQWKAIREGFTIMRNSIQTERNQMEKLWKAREKQLEKVLLNAAHIRGSIEGISGMEVDLNLIGEASEEE